MFLRNKIFPFSRFEVREKSMLPNFRPGDRVLTFNWTDPKIDNVIVFRLRGQPLIKRVEKVRGGLVYVRGDNTAESSRLGPIKKSQIVGKVILRY